MFIKLTYIDKTIGGYYYRYHVIDLNIDESIEDQIYKNMDLLLQCMLVLNGNK